jgi:hypothetical protein
MISERQNDGSYVTTPVYIGESVEKFQQCGHDWFDDAEIDSGTEFEWVKLQRCRCGAIRSVYRYLPGKDPND